MASEQSNSLAAELALFGASLEMPTPRFFEFLSFVSRVRRLELTLDEIVRDAQDSTAAIESADNVVFVNFVEGRAG